MQYSKWLPYILFLTVYCIGYGPYFLITPLPDFQQDSYIYFWAASLIRDGIIPFPKFTIDVPVGYPIFIWLVKTLFSKTGTIIVLQNLMFVGACFYCIYSFGLYRKAFGWIAAITLSIFAIDNFTIRLNTSLLSDGFYSSFLILVAAQIAQTFRRANPMSIGLLVCSLLICALIRPNGIYSFLMVPLTGILLKVQNSARSNYYSLFISFCCVLIIWSGINYYFKGIFLPSDPYRIALIYDHAKKAREKEMKAEKQISATKESVETPKAELFVQNITAFAELNPSFYFTNMPGRYERIYQLGMYQDYGQLLFNQFPVDSAAPGLKDYMLSEFKEKKVGFARIPEFCDVKSASRNGWMFLNHVIYKIHGVGVKNKVWVICYLVMGLLLVIRFFRSKFTDVDCLFVITLFLMHFVSVVVVTLGHNRFQTRYVHTTEVFLMLSVLLGIYIFLNKEKKLIS